MDWADWASRVCWGGLVDGATTVTSSWGSPLVSADRFASLAALMWARSSAWALTSTMQRQAGVGYVAVSPIPTTTSYLRQHVPFSRLPSLRKLCIRDGSSSLCTGKALCW